MVRIAYAVNALQFGGVEKYIVDLVNNLNEVRFEPYIVTFTELGPAMRYLERPVEVCELHKSEGNDMRMVGRFARWCRAKGIHIIHSNNWGTYLESVLAKKMGSVRTLVHVQHGLEMNDVESQSRRKRFIRNRLRQICAAFTDELVSVSKAGRNFIVHEWLVPRRRVKIIYNGVPIRPLRPENGKEKRKSLRFNDQNIVIGSVGRLAPVKNYKGLIRAFAIVHRKFPQTRLVIIGDGPERGELEELISYLTLTSAVRLLGGRTDVWEWLNAFDIFALASLSEGISLSILEAMSAALPVVVSKVGGNPEIVEHGVTGWLVYPNTPEAFSEALIKLITSPETCIKLGCKAREEVKKRFSLRRMVEEYENLYLKLLNRKADNERTMLKCVG